MHPIGIATHLMLGRVDDAGPDQGLRLTPFGAAAVTPRPQDPPYVRLDGPFTKAELPVWW
jgi:hypothetical protein